MHGSDAEKDEKMLEAARHLSLQLRRFNVPLVRAQWLLGARRLLRRQELPAEALAGHDEIDRYLLQEGRTPLVVSHRWLDRGWSPEFAGPGPDPEGFHLQQLRQHGWFGQPLRPDRLVFVDFCCLWQGPQTPQERLEFVAALGGHSVDSVPTDDCGVVSLLYSSPATAVVRLEEVPPSAPSNYPYSKSAWCTMERNLSVMGTKRFPTYSMRAPPPDALEEVTRNALSNSAPISPDEYSRAILEGEITCTNKKDCSVLPRIYAHRFRAAALGLTSLNLSILRASELPRVGSILPYFEQLLALDLSFVQDRGAEGFVEELRPVQRALSDGAAPLLRHLHLKDSGIGDAELREVLLPLVRGRAALFVYLYGNTRISAAARQEAEAAHSKFEFD